MTRTKIFSLLALFGFLPTGTAFANEILPGDTLEDVQELDSIQLPVFEKGKFAGYQEMPMEPDRAPNAEQTNESNSTRDSENDSGPASIKNESAKINGEE